VPSGTSGVAHRAKMVFLNGAKPPAGSLWALIGPDGPAPRLPDLYTGTGLSSLPLPPSAGEETRDGEKMSPKCSPVPIGRAPMVSSVCDQSPAVCVCVCVHDGSCTHTQVCVPRSDTKSATL